MSEHKVDSNLLNEIKQEHNLHHVKTHVEDSGLLAAKLELEIKKGAKLEHVEAPKTEVSDEVKQAFLEDQKEKKN